MQPVMRNPHIKNYTGEGFTGERILAITSVCLTIASTVLLIGLTVMQWKQAKLEHSIAQKQASQNQAG